MKELNEIYGWRRKNKIVFRIMVLLVFLTTSMQLFLLSVGYVQYIVIAFLGTAYLVVISSRDSCIFTGDWKVVFLIFLFNISSIACVVLVKV